MQHLFPLNVSPIPKISLNELKYQYIIILCYHAHIQI